MSNDLKEPLPQFCLVLEQYRRTSEGRVRGDRELVAHFFPYDAKSASDELFRFVPKDVRGPILASWKIRGPKSALKDDDDKVLRVVHDSLVAGDLEPSAVEAAFGPELLVGHVPLSSWWRFWRGGALSERAIGKALATAFDLGLFDASWFFDALEMRPPAGTLSSTISKQGLDVLAEGLSKADLADWVREIHESGDGTARGLLMALGWDRVVRQTRAPVLLAVLDKLAAKTGLTGLTGEAPTSEKGGAG